MDVMTAKKRSGRRVRVILVVLAALFLGGVWYALHVLETGDDRLINWIASKSPARVKADALVRQAMSDDPAKRKAGEAGIAALRRSGDIKALVEAIAFNVGLVVDARGAEGDGYRLCALVGAIGGPAVQPLLDLYRRGIRQDSDSFIRSFIRTWVPLYAGRRDSRRAAVAYAAQEALARMGEPLVGPLVAMAGSKSQQDQWFAMGVFRVMKGPAGTNALIKIFNTTTGMIQFNAMYALSEKPSSLAADTFAAIAPTWQRYHDSGYFAIIGLGRLKDPRVIPALCRMLKCPENMPRSSAASLLGGFTDPQVEPALISVLGDTFPSVRRAAAMSLGKMAGPSALAPLAPLKSDRDAGVRTAARDAIARIKARTEKQSSTP